MGTRASVSIKNADGIKTIYCHYDGYLSLLGNVLLKHFNTTKRVKELISYGDASSIYEHLTPISKEVEHTFLSPQKNTCVFYHRDRGENLVIRKFISETSLLRNKDIEYHYLFKDEKWYFCRVKGKVFSEWTELTQEIIKEDK